MLSRAGVGAEVVDLFGKSIDGPQWRGFKAPSPQCGVDVHAKRSPCIVMTHMEWPFF